MKEGSPISHVTCTIRKTKANWQLQYQLLKPILHIMQIWGARKTRGAHIVYIFVNAELRTGGYFIILFDLATQTFIFVMSTWKVLLRDWGRQARAKMRDGWPGANCHPDVFEQNIFSVCFCVPWDLVSFDWEHIACSCFPCLHWTADFPTGWVLETRWLMKFALVPTASCSILSNWSREKKMRLIILLADTTPSEKRLWTLSWTESESWLITALVACFGTKTCVENFCLWNSNNNIL